MRAFPRFKRGACGLCAPWSCDTGDFRRPVSGLCKPVPGAGLSCSARDQTDRPSIAYWRDHSAGASRRRATPIPRGSRPSTAVCTSLGARNASRSPLPSRMWTPKIPMLGCPRKRGNFTRTTWSPYLRAKTHLCCSEHGYDASSAAWVSSSWGCILLLSAVSCSSCRDRRSAS